MKQFLDLRLWCALLALYGAEASARFFPVNGGMVNQVTVGTANILTPVSLVATSNQVYVSEGTDNQILQLPNATKLPLDWWYRVLNNSAGYLTVRDGSGTDIASVNTTRAGEFYLKGRTNAAGAWKSAVDASAADLSNYYLKTAFVSAGPTLNAPVKTNGAGIIDSTLLPSSFSAWDLLGNAGLNAAANFIGTTDATDLVMKSANAEVLRLTSTGAIKTQLGTGLVKSSSGSLVLGVSGTDYQAPITTGTTAQYLKGDLSLGTFNTSIDAYLTGTAPISYSAGAISCVTATGLVAGCLSAADWTTFNGKQASLGFTPANVANNGSDFSNLATTFGNLANAIGSTRGSILYRGAAGWAILPPGTSTFVLTSNGAGADPSYQAAAGGGGCAASVLTKTTDYTILTSDFTCANKLILVEMNCSAACVLTLPAASNAGFEVKTVNIGSAQETVSTAGSDTFGTSVATTWVMQASPAAPQVGNDFWANGGTRWNGQ